MVGKQAETDTRNQKLNTNKPEQIRKSKLQFSYNSLLSRPKAASSKFSIDENDMILPECEENIDVKVNVNEI